MTDNMPDEIYILHKEGLDGEDLWCDHVPDLDMKHTKYVRADLAPSPTDLLAVKQAIVCGKQLRDMLGGNVGGGTDVFAEALAIIERMIGEK